jgi:regulator of cell morphogenesis and NO signaling
MNIDKALLERTVGELVAEDYRTAEVFKKNGIDFCCGGKKTIAEVCQQKGLDASLLQTALERLHEFPPTEARQLDFQSWPLPFLADYIVNVHHRFVLEKVPQIMQYASKVAKVHGHAYTETVTIAEKFERLAEELILHLKKEEHILFPYVKFLQDAKDKDLAIQDPPFGSVQNPIQMMEEEHEFAGDTMREIRQLSDDFTPPESACNTYRVLYKLLEEFEADLHQHVHLENNILFPKAQELEASLLNA